MALKKAPEAQAPTESPSAVAAAAAEPVIETPVPVDSGAATQTPALQPAEPVASAAEGAVATIVGAVVDAALTVAETAVTESLAPEVVEAAVAVKDAFIKVVNLRKTSFRQPSTGLWIHGGEVKHLANDGWLENHILASLLGHTED